jgi:hypothetical protein
MQVQLSSDCAVCMLTTITEHLERYHKHTPDVYISESISGLESSAASRSPPSALLENRDPHPPLSKEHTSGDRRVCI